MQQQIKNSIPKIIISVISMLLLISSCKEDIPLFKVEEITLNETEISLVVGTKKILTPNITPARADNKGIFFESSNPDVASVKGIGAEIEITAVSIGETVITVTTEDGNKTVKCNVSVIPLIIPVTNVTLDKSELLISIGETDTLKVTISPADATNKNIIWNSDNVNVATVDNNGVITPIAIGKATITATTENSNKQSACLVTVVDENKVAEVKLNVDEFQILVDETRQIIASVLPESATNKNIIWSSNNEDVATVNNDGLVTAKNIGEAIITATSEEGGKTAECLVKVVSEIIEINLLDTEFEDYSFERSKTNKSWPPYGGEWGGSDAIGIGKFGANSTAIRVLPETAPEPRVTRTGLSYLFVRMRDNEPTESLDWFWRKISKLTPGATYTFSFWYKTPPGSALPQTGNIKLGAVTDEADISTLSNALAETSFGFVEPSNLGNDGSEHVHKKVTITFTMPVGKSEVFISWVRNGQQQLYIDDLSLVKKN